MNDRRALLQTIADNPEDDAPRLIYADWLEEHGEEQHAELIRVQCRLAEIRKLAICLHGDIPGESCNDHRCLRCESATKLMGREQELLRSLGWPSGPPLERGLITSLAVTSECLNAILEEVISRNPVTTIRLTDWHGLDRSLPPNPREALPFLKRLEVPTVGRFNSARTGTDFFRSLQEAQRVLPDVEIVAYGERDQPDQLNAVLAMLRTSPEFERIRLQQREEIVRSLGIPAGIINHPG